MLTTADWLLGSNSQSTAGLSTLRGRMKRESICCSLHFQNEGTIYKPPPQQNVDNIAQINSAMLTVVPFIQKRCCNCGILFQAWFDTGWIWVLCLRMVSLYFYLFFYFYIWVFRAASWLPFFFVPSVFHACTLPLFFRRCEEFLPPPSTCVSALNQHRWNMYNMTANCFCNHEGFHRAWLPRPHCRFISQKKKKWKRRERKSSCLPTVNRTDFKELWAVGKLRNDRYRPIPELHNQTRSKSVRCIH